MTITANQQECKSRVLAREPLWKPEPPLTGGQTDHGENRGWVAEALQGTPYAVQIGSEWHINRQHPHGDQLWEELVSTQWGRDIRTLWSADGSPLPAGWKRGGFGAARKDWWSDNKHEIGATAKLIGVARNPAGVQASIAAVPGSGERDSIWDISPYSGPDDEPAWLIDCRNIVLFPEQYAALREHLKLPPDEVEPEPPGKCIISELQHCLSNARFAVKVAWNASNGQVGSGKVAAPRTDDSGIFYFFDPDNWEGLIKVLDRTAFGEGFWVYASFATDLGLDIKVVDTKTGREKTYSHQPPGTPFVAIADTETFRDLT